MLDNKSKARCLKTHFERYFKMPTTKDSVISLVKQLPEDSTLEDIMEHLYVKQKILKGQKELESGQFYTHEEAKEIMKEWLK